MFITFSIVHCTASHIGPQVELI